MVFSVLMLCQAASAKAENLFNFIYKDSQFGVSAVTLENWAGEQKFFQNPLLLPKKHDFNSSIIEFLGGDTDTPPPTQTYNYRTDKIYSYLLDLAQTFDRPVSEPVLKINNNFVTEFSPPQNGLKLDVYQTTLNALTALQIGNSLAKIAAYEILPQSSLSQTNNLGINELIAQGVSDFTGSPQNRRHNISVGLSKFKGLIIPQAQEFSFNQVLGPVDGEHGFLPELVIKAKEGTVPEFGGGLCQVSSTAFRGAMAAGLPITQRRNHAYAVSYYSPQGTDATIYPGVIDLKFINDTPGAIMIWPYFKDKHKLIFDFYGTKDSRQVIINKPEQFDKKPDGSMKATWTREVTSANGIKKTDVFKSTYLSPALFHKEEKFVTATNTPTTNLKAE